MNSDIFSFSKTHLLLPFLIFGLFMPKPLTSKGPLGVSVYFFQLFHYANHGVWRLIKREGGRANYLYLKGKQHLPGSFSVMFSKSHHVSVKQLLHLFSSVNSS